MLSPYSVWKPNGFDTVTDQSIGAGSQLVQNWTKQDFFPSWCPGTSWGRKGPKDHRHHYLLPGGMQGIPC